MTAAEEKSLTLAPGDSMVGTVIDTKYKLLSLLGEGGMGAVYEARHAETGRRVAVKVIRSDGKKVDEDRVRRFQREARAAGAVDTQHIAQVLDAGADPTTRAPYLVLEYLEGEDLESLLRRERALRPEVALRVAAQACLALVAAHGAGVLHRDIKPANLFLTRGEEGTIVVKVLDFGIAKMKRDGEAASEISGLTATGAILGSPRYMSPEQARNRQDLDARTDLWSLGVVMYRALAGRTPHEHVQGLGSLIISICSEPAPPIQSVAPWVPAEVAELVHRALQIDRAGRPTTAADLLASLKALVPGGLTIRRADLTGIGDDERTRNADPGAKVRHDATTVSDILGPTVAVAPGPTATFAVPQPPSGATGAEPPASPAGQPRSRTAVLAAVATALLLGVAGAIVYRSVKQAPSAAVTAPSPVPAPLPPPPTTSAPPPEPSAPAARSVKVTVLPAGVKVEVDGAPATVVDGAVTVTGTLGSTHEIRLSRGGRVKVQKVVISDHGALPEQVDLAPPAPTPAKPAENPLTPSRYQ